MADGDIKYLKRITTSNKVLRDKAFNFSKTQKHDQHHRGLASMVYDFFDKKRKVHSFRGNIWGADLADMQLISKFNKGFRFLIAVIDIYSKYAWVTPVKNKKDTDTNAS